MSRLVRGLRFLTYLHPSGTHASRERTIGALLHRNLGGLAFGDLVEQFTQPADLTS